MILTMHLPRRYSKSTTSSFHFPITSSRCLGAAEIYTSVMIDVHHALQRYPEQCSQGSLPMSMYILRSLFNAHNRSMQDGLNRDSSRCHPVGRRWIL